MEELELLIPPKYKDDSKYSDGYRTLLLHINMYGSNIPEIFTEHISTLNIYELSSILLQQISHISKIMTQTPEYIKKLEQVLENVPVLEDPHEQKILNEVYTRIISKKNGTYHIELMTISTKSRDIYHKCLKIFFDDLQTKFKFSDDDIKFIVEGTKNLSVLNDIERDKKKSKSITRSFFDGIRRTSHKPSYGKHRKSHKKINKKINKKSHKKLKRRSRK